jgi:hypothetical protein
MNYPTIANASQGTSSPAKSVTKGRSSNARLSAMFTTSPTNGTLNEASYKTQALELLLSGEVVDNQQVGNTNRDFAENGAPNYADVSTGAGGKPASAWTPNPASPGEGNDVNYASMPAPPDGFGTNPTNDLASVGGGAATSEGRNPNTSSTRMSATIKDGKLSLVAGKSAATVSAGG